MESADYHIELKATGGKTGKVGSLADGVATLEVASPPEFGGPGEVWSPEHMFVASVSSCLMTTFHSIAAMSGVEIVHYEDEATGRLERGENGLYRFETITLRPRVVISDERKLDRAQRLIEKAEKVCLIGRSVSSKIVLEPMATVVGT